MGDKIIDATFYQKTLRPDRQRSYQIICKTLGKMFHPLTSVVDYGCGVGWILHYMRARGVETVLGLEPNKHCKTIEHDCTKYIVHKSLTQPIHLSQDYDMAVSFEVAEHIPADYADLIIQNIIRHTKLVVFSAAYPGQGGYGHVNEQPWDYWREIFNLYGFYEMKELTKDVQKAWKKKQIKHWYWKNTRILEKW